MKRARSLSDTNLDSVFSYYNFGMVKMLSFYNDYTWTTRQPSDCILCDDVAIVVILVEK